VLEAINKFLLFLIINKASFLISNESKKIVNGVECKGLLYNVKLGKKC